MEIKRLKKYSSLLIILLTVSLFFILFPTLHQSHHNKQQLITYNHQGEQKEHKEHETDTFNKRQLKETVILKKSLNNAPQLQQPEQIISPPVAMETHGYIYLNSLSITPLSLGMSQLLTLQCWADKLSMNVIEPTLTETHLKTPPTRNTPTLQLNDVYDMNSWSQTENSTPFIDINEIDIRGIKQVLLVDITPFHDTYSSNCLNDSTQFKAELHLHYGLTVSHELCINSKERTIKETLDTIEDFLLFLKHQSSQQSQDKHKMAIVLRRWISNEWLTLPTLGEDSTHYCERMRQRIYKLHPSVSILRDVQQYYMNENIKSQSSVSVILTQDTQQASDMSICHERILTAFHNLKSTRNITYTYLTTLSNYPLINKQHSYKTFFRSLFHGAYTPKTWRQKLSQISTHSNVGYMSVLDQAISSYSTCLIVGSQGQYSHVIRRWSIENHSGQMKNNCVIKIQECLAKE